MTNFDQAVVISLDSGGLEDGKPASGGIFVIKKGDIEPIKLYPNTASLGNIYGSFTEVCGFTMIDGEGKTMSLAAFGEKEGNDEKSKIYEYVKKIFPTFNGIEYVDGGIISPKWTIRHNRQLTHLTDERVVNLGNLFKKELIAWAAQKRLEEIVSTLVMSAVEVTGLKNVIFTGGLFLNMIMNMKIREKLGKTYNLFFNPICGDFGNAVGAVFEQHFNETGKSLSFPFMPLYFGSSFQNEEIQATLHRLNLKFEKVDKISAAIDLIDQGKIVGWFQGKSELGPRALGNRSILSCVDDIKYKDRMNEKIKKRESWRPFCPTITDNKASYHLDDVTKAPYMILGFRMKHDDESPAVSHIDGTCRPQILERKDNSEFYDVVKGVGGIVLNTSFNLAGDPIVETPIDALMTFRNSEMDAIIINDFLVKRN